MPKVKLKITKSSVTIETVTSDNPQSSKPFSVCRFYCLWCFTQRPDDNPKTKCTTCSRHAVTKNPMSKFRSVYVETV